VNNLATEFKESTRGLYMALHMGSNIAEYLLIIVTANIFVGCRVKSIDGRGDLPQILPNPEED